MLEAFQECRAFWCSSVEHEQVPCCLDVGGRQRESDRLRLEAKQGAKLDVSEIESCLDYTISGWKRRAEVIFDVELVGRDSP